MSRFVNRSNTVQVDLGPCQCPGTPHDHDEAQVRIQLSYGEKLVLGELALVSFSNSALKLLELSVVAWNLRDGEGKPLAITPQLLSDLDDETAEKLRNAASSEEPETLPNPSSAPSASSSQESASPTPTTPVPASSTTS